MILKRITVTGIATLALIGAPIAAHASGTEPCGNGGTGYCMNAWNGPSSGNAVKMYYGNSSNENFILIDPRQCGGGDLVTIPSDKSGDTYCPFGNHNLDMALNYDPIWEISYNGQGLCIGTNAQGNGILQNCGADGTYDIQVTKSSCGDSGAQFGYLINKYWADQNDNANEGLVSNGFETQLQMNGTATNTCWGVGLG